MAEKEETYNYIDSFIADLLKGNTEIVYIRAKDLVGYTVQKGILGGKRKDDFPFPTLLGNVLTRYQLAKGDPATRWIISQECFQLIVWANTHQVIKRTGLANKVNALQKENAQLKEEKDKCEKENQRLKQLNNDLQSTFDKLGFQRIDKGSDDDEDNFGEKH